MDFSNPTTDEAIMFQLIADVDPHARRKTLVSYLMLTDIGYEEGSGQDVTTEKVDIERREEKADKMLEYLYG